MHIKKDSQIIMAKSKGVSYDQTYYKRYHFSRSEVGASNSGGFAGGGKFA